MFRRKAHFSGVCWEGEIILVDTILSLIYDMRKDGTAPLEQIAMRAVAGFGWRHLGHADCRHPTTQRTLPY